MTHHYMREQLKVKIVLEEECGRLMDNIYFMLEMLQRLKLFLFIQTCALIPDIHVLFHSKQVSFLWAKVMQHTVHNLAAMQHSQIRKKN